MKSLLTTFFIIASLPFTFGQNDAIKLLHKEFNISVNRTNFADVNGRFGCGFGAYQALLKKERFNILVGAEYNITKFFEKYIYEGHFAHSNDVDFTIHNFSIPLNFRYTMGKKVKAFIQAGAFAEFNFGVKSRGTMHTYIPDENNVVQNKVFPFSYKYKGKDTYGLAIGMGVRIPFGKVESIVQLDFKRIINYPNPMEIIFYNKYIRLSFGVRI